MKPSAHLSLAEVACRDGTAYPVEWRQTRLKVLASVFEQIRSACGDVPIRVLSAYRTPAYNASIKGAAKRSQHMQGRALDLARPKGWTMDQFYKVVRGVVLQDDCPAHGLGRYQNFVHVDIRDRADGRVTVWKGNRAWAEGKNPPRPTGDTAGATGV